MVNSLAVQWLGLGAFTARAWVRSLIGELRFCKVQGSQEKKIFFYSDNAYPTQPGAAYKPIMVILLPLPSVGLGMSINPFLANKT